MVLMIYQKVKNIGMGPAQLNKQRTVEVFGLNFNLCFYSIN